MEETIRGLLYLKSKLYNGIYKDKLGCIDEAVNILTPTKIKPRLCWNCNKEDCVECDSNFNRCPNCNGVLDGDCEIQYKHCPDCGQALLW